MEYPNDYDGFYFLPPENDDEIGFRYHFFHLKDELAGGKPIENTKIGDRFHVAFFKRDENDEPIFDDSFEAIFADPVEYTRNLIGSEIYGCFCRKTDKSEKWFEEYLFSTTKGKARQRLVEVLEKISIDGE